MHLILGVTALARAILIFHDKPPTLPIIILISETHPTLANDLAPLNVTIMILKSMIGMSDLAAEGASVMEDLRMTEVMIMSVIHSHVHLPMEQVYIDLQ